MERLNRMLQGMGSSAAPPGAVSVTNHCQQFPKDEETILIKHMSLGYEPHR